MGANLKSIELTNLMKFSGGIPSLIKLYHQANDKSSLEKENSVVFIREGVIKVDENVLAPLAQLVALTRPMSLLEFMRSSSCKIEQINKLKDVFIIEIDNDQRLSVQTSISQLLESILPENLLQDAHQKLATSSLFSGNDKEFLYHSFKSKDPKLFFESLEKVDIDIWEQFKKDSLAPLAEIFNEHEFKPKNIPSFKESIRWRHYLRLNFLLGKRKQVAHWSLTLLSTWKSIEKEQEILLAECIQYLNRNNQYNEVIEEGQLRLQFFSGLARTLLHIELAVAYTNCKINFSKAEMHLDFADRYLKTQKIINSPDEITSKSDKKTIDTLSLCRFERARIYEKCNRFEEAQDYYTQAIDLFSRINKPHFSSVALLNSCFILFKLQKWPELENRLLETQKLCETYGYEYALSGVFLIQSIQSRYFFNYSDCQRINSRSLYENTETVFPPTVLFDIIEEKILSFFEMGNFTLAKEHLQKLHELIQENPNNSYLSARMTWAQSKLDFYNMDPEDWRLKYFSNQELHDLSHSNWHYWLISGGSLQEYMLDPLSKYPLGRIRLIESQIQSLKEKTPYNLLSLLNQMEMEFVKLKIPSLESIAVLILKSYLKSSPSQKEEILKLAEEKIMISGFDEFLLKPLKLWLSAAQEGYHPDQDPEWGSCLEGIRWRWQKWFHGLSISESSQSQTTLQNSSPRIHIVSNQSKTLEHTTDSSIDLYIDEGQASVFFMGQEILPLMKSTRLRQLLLLILEHSPKPVSKSKITESIWGENYDPLIHDARIYTNLQRMRKYLGKKNVLISEAHGYKWNPQFKFQISKESWSEAKSRSRVQGLIMRALLSEKNVWWNRSQLVDFVESSEATVKRELSQLLLNGEIIRKGQGRSVKYAASL